MNSRQSTRFITVLAAVLVFVISVDAIAQDTATDPLELREEIRRCLETGAGARLTPETRARLRSCLENDLAAGLPVSITLAKLREGLRKGAPDISLERAVSTMSGHVNAADERRRTLLAVGVADSDRAVRTLAQSLWSGLSHDDLDRLCNHARHRLEDGACTLDDVAGAAETTMAMRARGVDADRAIELAGNALLQGFDEGQILLIGAMVETTVGDRARLRDLMQDLENSLGAGMSSSEMIRHMVQSGWIGQSGTQEFGGTGPASPGNGGPDDPGGSGGPGGNGGSGNGNGGN